MLSTAFFFGTLCLAKVTTGTFSPFSHFPIASRDAAVRSTLPENSSSEWSPACVGNVSDSSDLLSVTLTPFAP